MAFQTEEFKNNKKFNVDIPVTLHATCYLYLHLK